MTGPAYYRPRVPGWLWVTLSTTALGVVLVVLVREVAAQIRQGERQRVYAEAQAWAAQVMPSERHTWQRRFDSLAQVVRGRDTMIVTRLRTVRDTAWLPTDTAPAVRYVACRAQLDTLADACAVFRASATAALSVSDSLHRADSVTTRSLSFVVSAARDSLRTTQQQLRRAPSWRTVGTASVSSASVGVLLCLMFCR